MFLPRGAVIAEELEKLAKETEFAAGYQRVRTPHIARESLYKKSGHLPYYAESMFPPMELRGEGHADSLWVKWSEAIETDQRRSSKALLPAIREIMKAHPNAELDKVANILRRDAEKHGVGDDLINEAISTFLKVTQSYWPGLFHCYDVADLPRTNNDLEHCFGAVRYSERRASGRRPSQFPASRRG